MPNMQNKKTPMPELPPVSYTHLLSECICKSIFKALLLIAYAFIITFKNFSDNIF